MPPVSERTASAADHGLAESEERIDERERLARDLHDRVIQRLFATSLSLQATATLSTDARVAGRIDAAIDDLDATIREIRTVVFALQRGRRPDDLRDAALDLCRASARVLGFEPAVGFDGPVDTLTSDEVADDLLATLREALANVARHAGASAVRVDLSATGMLELRVTDDGRGLPDGVALLGDGLRNMAARAERWGGPLEIAPAEPNGTTVRWRVPLD